MEAYHKNSPDTPYLNGVAVKVAVGPGTPVDVAVGVLATIGVHGTGGVDVGYGV